jgi:hypothetical protein
MTGTHLATYVGLVHRGEQTLAESFRQVGEGHAAEADVTHMCETLATMCDRHVERLGPVARRYGEVEVEEPARLHAEGLSTTRQGGVGLLRDLQDLHLLASLVSTSWTVVEQAAQGARDIELFEIAQQCGRDTSRQLGWLTTRLKAAAPQALLVG